MFACDQPSHAKRSNLHVSEKHCGITVDEILWINRIYTKKSDLKVESMQLFESNESEVCHCWLV